jgi:hypothetical protein
MYIYRIDNTISTSDKYEPYSIDGLTIFEALSKMECLLGI